MAKVEFITFLPDPSGALRSEDLL